MHGYKNGFKCMHVNLPCVNIYAFFINRHQLIIQQNVTGVVIALEYGKKRVYSEAQLSAPRLENC